MSETRCPHCNYLFDDEEIFHGGNFCDFPTENDGDQSDFYCPSCSTKLYAVLTTTPSWSFTDEDGDDL